MGKREYIVTAAKLAAAFIICVAAFTALKLAATAIPRPLIYDNLVRSAETLRAEGAHYTLAPMDWAPGSDDPDADWHVKVKNMKPTRFAQLDNYTTAITLGICAANRGGGEAASLSEEAGQGDNAGRGADVVRAAFADAYYSDPKISALQRDSKIESLCYVLESDVPANDSHWYPYARYWHGDIAVIKPLLLLMDLQGIRIVFGILGCALAVACAVTLSRSASPLFAVGFVLSLLGIGVPIALMSTSLAFCFFIALAATLAISVRYRRRKLESPLECCVPFFVIGALTAYLDFLCTPVVTLGLPLIVLLRIGVAGTGVTAKWLAKVVLAALVSWALGYALLWLAKLGLSSIVLGRDFVGQGIRQALFRTGEAVQGLPGVSRLAAPAVNLAFMGISFSMWPVITLGAVAAVRVWRGRTRPLPKSTKALVVALLIVGALPILWYVFAANHSIQHYWFTYRALAVTVFACFAALEVAWGLMKGKAATG